MLRTDRPVADVLQEKGAGAVGTLRLTGTEAALAEQGRLLIACRPADRQAVWQKAQSRSCTVVGSTRPNLG